MAMPSSAEHHHHHHHYHHPAAAAASAASASAAIPAAVAEEDDDAVELAQSFISTTGRVSLSLTGAGAGAGALSPHLKPGWRARLGLAGLARRTLGITCLMVTVFLWTASNFLASSIFSDKSFNKPFFVVYVNSSIFAMSTIPMLVRFAMRHGLAGVRDAAAQAWREQRHGAGPSRLKPAATGGAAAAREFDAPSTERLLLHPEEDDGEEEDGPREAPDSDSDSGDRPDPNLPRGRRRPAQIRPPTDPFPADHSPADPLTFGETVRLSIDFSMLWFLANYFASACLEYTSVASATILTSTSSVWTLIMCALWRVEGFTVRKLLGVAASLAGVVLISTVDLAGSSDRDRGSFPHKTPFQLAAGDSMALVSAVVYGLYVTVMKRRVGNEDRVDLALFMGLVGVVNLMVLWPGLVVLHLLGVETFELPPTGKIWIIILANSLSSYVSDMSWAYAMLLTTPLVVTVGLSLTIPLSLIGEMIQYGQYSSVVYWLGAGVVLFSFVFINNESREEEEAEGEGQEQRGRHHDSVA